MRLKLVYIKRQSLYKFKYNKLCRSVKLQKKERKSSRRRDEFSIYHFVINAELGEVQIRENAFDLLECQLEPISKGFSAHAHKVSILHFELLLGGLRSILTRP